jgi:SAM-dependent methyltransferase
MNYDSTRTFYELHAADYYRQTNDRRLETYWSMLEEAIFPRALILDLGCGSGRDLKHFATAGYRPLGIDYSLPLLKLAVHSSKQLAVLGDIRLLPFKAKTFDAAWAMASLLHLPRRAIGGALLQIASCLRPRAPFFAALKLGTGEETDWLGRFTTFYSIGEWAELLRDSGYAISELQVNTEHRTLPDGSLQEIEWIVSLATVKHATLDCQHQHL